MTKEKFIYELIDKWLYPLSLHCVLMENYTQSDRTIIYESCSSNLEECLDYYEQLYAKVDQDLHSEEEIDAKLEFLIQKLRNGTMKNIIEEIEVELCLDLNNKDEFLKKNLYYDEKGKQQEINKKSLMRFLTELRKYEESRK